ncbi:uncharacterized protein LOC114525665 [Dendronephthya gigantea]|uniref:uncharacterized protein LOC114525665 n=1 Tax=Dendronephthya gigantea TaxID=151771 RepID=UPI00106BFA99|nr:uncharacterized protein LOC114525665 [Dendronephthya gigantea]
MFIETIDKLVSEFQQRLGTTTSIPWGWFFTKLVTLLSRYPTGVTKAIMLSELECSWRKIEKLQAKGGMNSADSLRSIVLSRHLSPQAVFEVFLKEVKNVEATQTRVAVLMEHETSSEHSFTMEMYLHQKLYGEVEQIMANGYKLRFTGCRLFDGRRNKSLKLLPSESFVVLVNDGAIHNFTTLEGLDEMIDSQYINSIIKVKVSEISMKKSIHCQNGHTANRITVLVSDDIGIQAKLNLWEEYLVMAKLFEAGDTLFMKQCFLLPDKSECFTLEFGPETIIFCQPLTHEQEILPSQRDGSKVFYVSKDNRGMLDFSMYPERLSISEINQNMSNITLTGQVVSVGVRKLLRREGVDMVQYELGIKDESGICKVVVVEPYKVGAMVYCGQFVHMKNLQVSGEYSIGVVLDLNTDNGGLWNLSSLQGWLATSPLCTISSLASLDLDGSPFVLKGMISDIQPRDGKKQVVRIHCSCQGQVDHNPDGQSICDNCQTKGMAEISRDNKAIQLFNLDGFWCWQYNLCITIMDFEHRQVQATITNDVGEKLLQLTPSQLLALGGDGQRRVFECTLGQECLYGFTSFKGKLLVSAVNHV